MNATVRRATIETKADGTRVIEFFVPGKLPTYNQLRFTKIRASIALQKTWTQSVALIAKAARVPQIRRPVRMSYAHAMPNNRADLSNRGFGAQKLVEDGLVQAGVLIDDGPKYVVGFEHEFSINPTEPGVRVTLVEQP